MRFRWRRKARTESAEEINFQALMLIHLGRAMRAHQEGDILRAIRHLGLAAEAIMALIEEWSGGKQTIEIVEDEVVT